MTEEMEQRETGLTTSELPARWKPEVNLSRQRLKKVTVTPALKVAGKDPIQVPIATGEVTQVTPEMVIEPGTSQIGTPIDGLLVADEAHATGIPIERLE